MRMKKYIIASAAALVFSVQAMAIGIFDNLTYYARAGYELEARHPWACPQRFAA